MKYTTQLILNPPCQSEIADYISERTLEQLDKFYHCSIARTKLSLVFGEEVINKANFAGFCTAFGLYGLANKIRTFFPPAMSVKTALDYLPSGIDDYSVGGVWMIGAGINFELNPISTKQNYQELEDVLQVVHQYGALPNWVMDIDHLQGAVGDTRLDVQKIICDLKHKTALDLFGEMADLSIWEHKNYLEKNGYSDDMSDFGLSTDDIERINQCDLAILAIMRQNFIDYDINININYFAEDVLASFMGVYDLFVKYQEKETVEAVRQAIAGVKNQPTEEKEQTMQPTRPTLNSANTLSTATLTNKALADKILSYAKENILADFVKLIDANSDIYGKPNLSELVTVEVDNTEDERTIHLAGENYSFIVHFAPADYYREKEHPSKAVLYIGREVSELDLQNMDQYKKLGMNVIWNDGSYLFSDFKKQLDNLVSFFNLLKLK